MIKKIPDIIKNELISTIENNSNEIKILFLDNKIKINEIAKYASFYEKALFEEKEMHDFLYQHLFWNEKDSKNKPGFYVKTIETAPNRIMGMKMLKSWAIVRFLDIFLKLSNLIKYEYEEKYKQCSGFFLITSKNDSNIDYIKSGMIFQKIWLTATKLGLFIQPHGGVVYLTEYLKTNKKGISKKTREIILNSYKKIQEDYDTKDNITMLFRVGYSTPMDFFLQEKNLI